MENQALYSHEKLKQYRRNRDEEIIRLVNMGLTYQKIADIHSMSRQRVCQIVLKYRQQIWKIED